ncbi:polysaccharide deacetylase family protein [Telmatocola sphagniphila]|uniref:Polysaccharide deacetylase family protein n=1 Tax=Telmatocola sphagniphila TaxID=1123043 RepID=A0A8E6EYC6_9BACT|nr:XrtA system polysaccharide deacetylase [Telmatocola sphagniphila]QVL32543.1 polysaccharide deacetylase family protein [Telmatocola sphagniphila]
MVPGIEVNQNIVFSFDVEEHYRIEAAANCSTKEETRQLYADRMVRSTRTLLDLLAEQNRKATFFVVGQIAESHPNLIREIVSGGHELASHSYAHTSIRRLEAKSFREDLRKSKQALEQVGGCSVVGFRAPTFSVIRPTNWALDVLAEEGFLYDSSIYPVHHDRYGVPEAPREPFLAKGPKEKILELPPVTWRKFGQNLPVAGGGYFRLFPLAFMRRGIAQTLAQTPSLAMLYFHPWEFDSQQPKLALGRISRWRTYVGIKKSIPRLRKLLNRYPGRRAIDVVNDLLQSSASLKQFQI